MPPVGDSDASELTDFENMATIGHADDENYCISFVGPTYAVFLPLI